MLKKIESIRFSRLTDGQAKLSLLAENQQLRGLIATRQGKRATAEIHYEAARHFKSVVSSGTLHTAPTNSLLSFNSQNFATSPINNIILEARQQNKPAITMSNRDLEINKEEVSRALNNVVVDEFTPTPEQLAQCRGEAATDALAQLLPNGRTFDPGTFDHNTQEVYPIPETGRLVVLNKQDLATLTQNLFESCAARVAMENIINKKVSEAGNFAIYSVMDRENHQFFWNAKVTNRLFLQEEWVKQTAKGTGLTEENVRLVLENSAMNLNEETPSETLVKTGEALRDLTRSVPDTLPNLFTGDTGGGLPDIITGDNSEFSLTDLDLSSPESLIVTSGKLLIKAIASQNFAFIIITASIFIAAIVINAINKRRREEIFTSLPDPTIIAAQCIDANIPLEDCEGLPPDFNGGDDDDSSSNNVGLIIGGIIIIGIGALLVSNRGSNDVDIDSEDQEFLV